MSQPTVASSETPPARASVLRAAVGVAVHAVVDCFSIIIIALMPLLRVRDQLSDNQQAVLLMAGGISGGIVQPFVAWLSDRYDNRVPGTIGVVVAVIAISMIGYADGFVALMTIQIAATAGIGAFHPAAVAAVGQLCGKRRSLGVSAFFTAGMAGGVIGSLVVPRLVEEAGLRSLVWLLLPGLFSAIILGWAIHSVPHRSEHEIRVHQARSASEQSRNWVGVVVLAIGNIIRFSVNMAIIHLMTLWSMAWIVAGSDDGLLTEKAGAQASVLNGQLQAAMPFGMGASGLLAGWLLPRRFERHALLICPWIGVVAIVLLPWAGDVGAQRAGAVPLVILLTVLAGVGFGAMIPVSMSMAQRLLPHRTGLASALTLGCGWVFAAFGPIVADRMKEWQGLSAAFYMTAGLLATASLVGVLLPRTEATDAR